MPMLDINKIKEGIEESFKVSESARDKDLVLVVGQTGSGKSTTVNYLLGYPLKRVHGGKAELELLQSLKSYAKMGDDAESVTTHPAAYEGPDGFVYCDCPGFKDNRGDEQRVIVSVSTEAVVNRAKSIRAVIVVVEWGAIDSSRGEGLRDVALTLGALFNPKGQRSNSSVVSNNNNDLNLGKSILFVITKANMQDVDHDYCMEKVNNLLKAENKRLKEEESKLNSPPNILFEKDQSEKTIESLVQKCSILTLMQKNPQNIVLVNVFDKSETRKQILECLRSLQCIPKGIMNFNAADTARDFFCKRITNEMIDAVAFMKTILDLPNDIEQTKAEQIKLEKEDAKYRDQLQSLNSGRDLKGERDPIVVANRGKITKNKEIISLKQQEIEELTKNQQERELELLELDVADETVFYRQYFEGSRGEKIKDTVDTVACATIYPLAGVTEVVNRIDDDDVIWGVLGVYTWLTVAAATVATATISVPTALVVGALRRRNTDFKYTGAPFIRVDEACDSGKIKRSTYEPENGKYVAHYESGRVGKARAGIIVKGEKRNKPEIEIGIGKLKKEIEILQEKTKELTADLERIRVENEKLEALNDKILRHDDISRRESKLQLENLIKDTKMHITHIQRKLVNKQNQLEKCKIEFEQRDSFWKIIQEMSNFIDFNDGYKGNIVDEFKESRRRIATTSEAANVFYSTQSEASSSSSSRVKFFSSSVLKTSVTFDQTLLNGAKVIPKDNKVELVFNELETVKKLQQQLMKVGFHNLNEPGNPRKIEFPFVKDINNNQSRYVLTLTKAEYNAVYGDNEAYIRLVSGINQEALSPAFRGKN
jgi:energy-coupling factor transporter ATP-binding protein EcfA2